MFGQRLCISAAVLIGLLIPAENVSFSQEEMEAGKHGQDALAVAEQVVEDFPDEPLSYVLKGKVHQGLSQWDDAVEALKKSLSLDDAQTESTLSIAQIYEKTYEYEKAIEWYQSVLERGLEQQGVYERIGLAFAQLNQTDSAVNAFRKEVEAYPENASAHYYLAQQLVEQEKWDDAKSHAKRCMELDKRYPEPVYLLATIAREQGEQEKAKEYLTLFREKKAKEQDYVPQGHSTENDTENVMVQAHLLAGVIYYQHRQDEESKRHLRKVIDLDPKHVQARVNLLQLYTANRNLQQMEHMLRELHTLRPGNVEFTAKLGEILNAKQKWNESIPMLEDALSIEPNPNVKRTLAQALILSMADPGRGLQLMQEVVRVQPDSRNYDLLSRAYYVNQDLTGSLEAMRMAMELAPDNPSFRQKYQKLQSLK